MKNFLACALGLGVCFSTSSLLASDWDRSEYFCKADDYVQSGRAVKVWRNLDESLEGFWVYENEMYAFDAFEATHLEDSESVQNGIEGRTIFGEHLTQDQLHETYSIFLPNKVYASRLGSNFPAYIHIEREGEEADVWNLNCEASIDQSVRTRCAIRHARPNSYNPSGSYIVYRYSVNVGEYRYSGRPGTKESAYREAQDRLDELRFQGYCE